MRARVFRQVALFLFLLPATAAITGCAANSIDSSQTSSAQPSAGSPPPSIRAAHLALADSGNSRVLIYDAPIGNGASASVVLGQPNFTDSANSGNDAYPNTVSPGGIARDAEGDLFVTDGNHCRVLEFQPPFTMGMNASVAIGWPSLTYTNARGNYCLSDRVSTLQDPVAVATDSQGDLWVADQQIGKVYEYVPPFSTGMAASVVIGTPLCDGSILGSVVPTAQNFCEPVGIAFDPEGDLWVSDPGFSRVLEFEPPFSTGMAASLEIGQPAFTSWDQCSPTPSASCLAPAAVAFDAGGNLWVADPPDNRVLEFAPPFTNGMAACLVLGQPDFTSGALKATAANAFYFHSSGASAVEEDGGLWFDSSGDLLVGDGGNERILVFTPPFSNDMNASSAIGQPNTTSGGPCAVPATSTLCAPRGILTY